MLNKLGAYFDLYSEYRPGRPRAQAAAKDDIALWRQLLIYLASVLGVILGPYVSAALGGTLPDPSVVFAGPNRIFWSCVFGFAVLPPAYKLVFDPKKPFVVQISFALVAGFLAQKLVPVALALFAGKA